VLVIEHNLDVIKTADYVIDLGPEGGERGGTIVGVGTPEQLAANEASYTGGYLKDVLVDERAHGHIAANAVRMEAIEAANLASLEGLVKSDRVKVEA
jgi:excinuclease ABC subunit A